MGCQWTVNCLLGSCHNDNSFDNFLTTLCFVRSWSYRDLPGVQIVMIWVTLSSYTYCVGVGTWIIFLQFLSDVHEIWHEKSGGPLARKSKFQKTFWKVFTGEKINPFFIFPPPPPQDHYWSTPKINIIIKYWPNFDQSIIFIMDEISCVFSCCVDMKAMSETHLSVSQSDISKSYNILLGLDPNIEMWHGKFPARTWTDSQRSCPHWDRWGSVREGGVLVPWSLRIFTLCSLPNFYFFPPTKDKTPLSELVDQTI